MNHIPSVDLNDFLSGDEKRKQCFTSAIGNAYENIGFVALKGHFLDNKLVEQLYSQIKRFFDLPLEVKQQYEIPGIGGQRGYVSFGKESAKGKKEGDLKEFWHFGQYIENNPNLKMNTQTTFMLVSYLNLTKLVKKHIKCWKRLRNMYSVR